MEVQGVDQLVRLSKALKDAANKDLQRELTRGISKATKPFVASVRKSAQDKLPRGGGLAARVAKTQIRTIRRVGATTAGIRVQTRGSRKSAAALADKGTVNHPVFGNRDVWQNRQPVTPGWWTDVAEGMLPQTLKDVQRAMNDVAKKIERSA